MALWLIRDVGLPYGIAMVATAVVAVAVGLAVDLVVMRPLRERPPLDAAVASLGLLLALQGIVVIIWGANLRTFPSPVPQGSVGIAGLQVTHHQLLVVGVVAGPRRAWDWPVFFRSTRAGTAIRAHVEDRTTARLLGVAPARCPPSPGRWPRSSPDWPELLPRPHYPP